MYRPFTRQRFTAIYDAMVGSTPRNTFPGGGMQNTNPSTPISSGRSTRAYSFNTENTTQASSIPEETELTEPPQGSIAGSIPIAKVNEVRALEGLLQEILDMTIEESIARRYGWRQVSSAKHWTKDDLKKAGMPEHFLDRTLLFLRTQSCNKNEGINNASIAPAAAQANSRRPRTNVTTPQQTTKSALPSSSTWASSPSCLPHPKARTKPNYLLSSPASRKSQAEKLAHGLLAFTKKSDLSWVCGIYFWLFGRGIKEVKDWYTVESFRPRGFRDRAGKQDEYKDHKNLRWLIEREEGVREESKETLAWQAWGARNIDETTSPDPYKVQVWGQELEYGSEEYFRKRYRRTGNWVCEKVMEGYSWEMWEEEEGGRLKAQKGYDVKEEAEVRVAGEGTGEGKRKAVNVESADGIPAGGNMSTFYTKSRWADDLRKTQKW